MPTSFKKCECEVFCTHTYLKFVLMRLQVHLKGTLATGAWVPHAAEMQGHDDCYILWFVRQGMMWEAETSTSKSRRQSTQAMPRPFSFTYSQKKGAAHLVQDESQDAELHEKLHVDADEPHADLLAGPDSSRPRGPNACRCCMPQQTPSPLPPMPC